MTDAELDALVARMTGRVHIETACGNRSDNPNNYVQLMDEGIAALTTLRKQRDELREALDSFEREYLPSGIRETPEWQAIRKAAA